ncbi:Riboflavin biosynthesis protein RibD [Pseudodesulfovibrio profundus]|uniref:Riboflavin biosynthesis protein RibD n=1 Tax=Pseudodesulfovibrio profundus TaxID=57320 RepID=A0A2C8FBM5_9BACT|nr:bifunctional diaminohydroxyphosphoribosylaminopyrimidine deaminase/5-amino-6-(5-phosphoribosylamino)uracil reductase RibD [Pseudodesulfovibrio profundus]SOB59569.1 Riboflavin biosynthesis protein RibD [Pseudodesulfovibrio profundus]
MSTCRVNSSNDEGFMACALDLAAKGRGPTAPNPCVGAVLVADNGQGEEVVAGGWHTQYGALHAERECLAAARERQLDPCGMTMYVTLEPCNHHGKTPPCTEAIIEAGITRVVIGTRDPNPIAAGGIEKLREHGIQVTEGVLENECRDMIADFLHWQNTAGTFNIVKMATTLDGKIASRHMVPEPVSSAESFARVHDLRGMVHAVVVGGGTFRADNPSLTCRQDELPKDFRQPFGVIVTSRLPDKAGEFKLLRDRPDQAIFFTTEEAARSTNADALRELGARVWPLGGTTGDLDLKQGFERLRDELQCYYTLIEGGGRFAMQCVESGLAQELVQFIAPRILGDDQAPSAFSGRENISMSQTRNFRIIKTQRSGPDMMMVMRPVEPDAE